MEDKETMNTRFIDADGGTTYTNKNKSWTEFAYTDSMVREWNENIDDDTQHLNMISLFDYFGGAVGSVIGRETYKASVEQGVKSKKKIRRVKGADGVRVYPKAWLEMFFGNLDTALKLLEKEVKEN